MTTENETPVETPEVDKVEPGAVLWTVTARKDDSGSGVAVAIDVGDEFLPEFASHLRTYMVGKTLRDVADRLIEDAVAASREDEDEL